MGRLPVTELGRPHVPVGRPHVSVTVLPVPNERLLDRGETGTRLEVFVAAARLLVVAVAVPEGRRFAAAAAGLVAEAAAAALELCAEASETRDARIARSAASPSRRERSTKDCDDERRDPEVRALTPTRCDDDDMRERVLRGVDPPGVVAGVAGDPLAGDAAASLAGEALGVVKPEPLRPWLRRSAVDAAVAAACADAATAAKASDARLLDWFTELERLARAPPPSAAHSSRHSPTVDPRLRVGDARLRVGECEPWRSLRDDGVEDGGGCTRSRPRVTFPVSGATSPVPVERLAAEMVVAAAAAVPVPLLSRRLGRPFADGAALGALPSSSDDMRQRSSSSSEEMLALPPSAAAMLPCSSAVP